MDDEALFSRQRRNLILTAMFLFLAVCLDLRVTKLNFLGNELAMRHEYSVWPILTVLCLYFLLRYWQVSSIREICATFNEHFKKRLVVYARRILRGANAGDTLRFADAPFDTNAAPIAERVDAAVVYLLPDKSAEVRIAFIRESKLHSIEAQLSDPDEMPVHIEPKNVRLIWWRALISAQFNTPLFTEHLLPILLALTALAYTAWRA